MADNDCIEFGYWGGEKHQKHEEKQGDTLVITETTRYRQINRCSIFRKPCGSRKREYCPLYTPSIEAE